MHHRRKAGLAAGLLLLALAAPAAAAGPANVTIRIEGKQATIVEEQALRTTLQPVSKNGDPSCPGTSVAGALDQAVAGDWDGPWFSPTYGVERIRGESYPFGETADGWAYWVNHREPSVGMCEFELQEGDDVLFFVARCEFDGSGCANAPVLPLELRAPASAVAGSTGEVQVMRYAQDGSAAPVAGARVTGPGVAAPGGRTTVATTGPGGRATVVFGQAGGIRLKAEKDGFARSAAEVVHVSAPGSGPAPAGGVSTPVAGDTTAPAGRIRGIREKQRFSRRRAPRVLRGTVSADPAGLRAVKLSLTRSRRGRCAIYSPSLERFRRARCGRRVNFKIGDRQNWSYLLPRRLGPGRYVLDVIAVDKLGNRDRLARGRSRVVFFVGADRARAMAAAAGSPVTTMVVGRDGVLRDARRVRAVKRRVKVGRRRCAVAAGTPLAALAALRIPIRLRDYGACGRRPRDAGGVFVNRVGAERNRGQDGWVYKVGRRVGSGGAADPAGPFGTGRRLRGGDRLLWFWCDMQRTGGCQRTLEATPDRRAAAPGETVVVTVRGYDDNGRGVAVPGATVRLGDAVAVTGPGGAADVAIPAAGRLRLTAEAAGMVPSFPEEVRAG